MTAATLAAPAIVRAADDAVTIAWPSDVPGWDPNQRFTPDAQSLFKAVFDQPLDQDPDLKLVPHLIRRWELSADGLTLPVELRDDVVFHNGDRMTADDFRFTFFQRIKTTPGLDIANSWRKVQDIEVLSPTRAVMHFNSPAPTAPVWLAFLGSYLVPKGYVEQAGAPAFAQKPVGTGPYRLVEWEINGRIVLERNDRYWGPKPAIGRVTVQIIKDPSARAAAVQSGQVDLAINLPVREAVRLQGEPKLAAELDPITRIILLQVRNDLGFEDANVRLAAHHAIDKAALSRAFYNNAAVPLSQLATPGTPGFMADFSFTYDPELAKQLLAKSGFGPDKPVKIGFATTNGQFPSDYDIARAIAQMWKRVGIEADVQVIEYAKYFELNRGHKLPEATLYSFDNATGDPEIFVGYMLNPKLPFSPWQDMTLGQRVIDLFNVADTAKRYAGWQAIDREAMEMGAKIPLLQSVLTLARQKNLAVTKYANGWVLPQTMRWT
jgi:peptide/nickel transport system substrate-binding protein